MCQALCWMPGQGEAQACVRELKRLPTWEEGGGQSTTGATACRELRPGPGSALCIYGIVISTLEVSDAIQSNGNRSQGQEAGQHEKQGMRPCARVRGRL